jgi:hypothetical protein
MPTLPMFEDTPENRFKLTIYNALLLEGVSPKEAAARAHATWARKQAIYNSWHAKAFSAVCSLAFWGAVGGALVWTTSQFM